MIQWIKNHPWQNILYAVVFSSLATAMAYREDWKPQLLGLFLLGLICWVMSYLFGRTAVVIAALLSTIPDARAQAPFPPRDAEQFEPAALGVAAGVAVICVGAYCVYKFNKFCAKKFPPKDSGTNSLSAAASGDEYGAAYNYGATGSCDPEEYELVSGQAADDGTLYRLNILVDSPYSIAQSMAVTTGAGQGFQTFLEFQAEMAGHGLNISGRADGSQSFSWNRVTIDPSMSPISFDPITKTVRNTLAGEGEMRRIVVSRSNNLQDWSHFVSTEVGVGAGIQIVDATRHGQMFYKVEMSQP